MFLINHILKCFDIEGLHAPGIGGLNISKLVGRRYCCAIFYTSWTGE